VREVKRPTREDGLAMLDGKEEERVDEDRVRIIHWR
jgi:hypothetical protein